MLRSSACSVLWADDPIARGCSDFSTAASESLFQQQEQSPTMMHFEPVQSFAGATSSGRNSSSRAASSRPCVSQRRGLKDGFDDRVGAFHGGQFSGSVVGPRESARRPVAGASGDGERGGWKREEEVNATQILDRVSPGKRPGKRVDDKVDVQIEKLDNNSRKIVAKIVIEAPLDIVWAILTDYEHLADFIPGLAVNELLEKRHNGARLYQVGEQNIALGVKFKAKAVVDCVEKPEKVHGDYVRRDIDFETLEGDFQVFRGTWRMEQPVSKTSSASRAAAAEGGAAAAAGEEVIATILSYILVVQPKLWLPVGLVEGRLASEMKTNLVCIRRRSMQPSSR